MPAERVGPVQVLHVVLELVGLASPESGPRTPLAREEALGVGIVRVQEGFQPRVVLADPVERVGRVLRPRRGASESQASSPRPATAEPPENFGRNRAMRALLIPSRRPNSRRRGRDRRATARRAILYLARPAVMPGAIGPAMPSPLAPDLDREASPLPLSGIRKWPGILSIRPDEPSSNASASMLWGRAATRRGLSRREGGCPVESGRGMGYDGGGCEPSRSGFAISPGASPGHRLARDGPHPGSPLMIGANLVLLVLWARPPRPTRRTWSSSWARRDTRSGRRRPTPSSGSAARPCRRCARAATARDPEIRSRSSALINKIEGACSPSPPWSRSTSTTGPLAEVVKAIGDQSGSSSRCSPSKAAIWEAGGSPSRNRPPCRSGRRSTGSATRPSSSTTS